MEIKIGDRVRFLDAVGGGIVSGFKKDGVVLVQDEDGFELPVLKQQCVVVDVPETSKSSKETSDAIGLPVTESLVRVNNDQELNVSFAFVEAVDRNAKGDFTLYLVNDSRMHLLVHVLTMQGNQSKTQYAGEVKAGTRVAVAVLDRNNLDDWGHLCLQVLVFNRHQPMRAYAPFSIERTFAVSKLFKAGSFVQTKHFSEPALWIPMIRDGESQRDLLISPEELLAGMKAKKEALQAESYAPRSVSSKRRADEMLEVDLHIHALLDTTAGMQAADMLRHQLDVVRQTLDAHRRDRGLKIVFIHGKGDGVLRAALIKELSLRYKHCRWQDASFQEYGFGATQVTIG